MGLTIILTEAQVAKLEKKVGKTSINEMTVGLSCTNLRYGALSDFLGDKDKKKLGNNTIVHKTVDYDRDRKEVIAVRYWSTDIITIDSDNLVRLFTGGHTTPTTKDRLNQFLSCRNAYIFQKQGKWYIRNEYQTVDFEDGMEVLPDGQFPGIGRIDTSKIPMYKKQIKSLDIDPKFRELYGISDEEPSKN